MNSVYLLEHRLFALEQSVYGNKLSFNSNHRSKDQSSILLTKLLRLKEKADSLDNSLPELNVIVEKVKSVQHVLDKKKIDVKQLVENADWLHSQRDKINELLQTQSNIEMRKSVLDEYIDEAQIHSLEPVLETLSKQLEEVRQCVIRQNEEIEQLVEVFEKTMVYVSGLCEKWEYQLAQSQNK